MFWSIDRSLLSRVITPQTASRASCGGSALTSTYCLVLARFFPADSLIVSPPPPLTFCTFRRRMNSFISNLKLYIRDVWQVCLPQSSPCPCSLSSPRFALQIRTFLIRKPPPAWPLPRWDLSYIIFRFTWNWMALVIPALILTCEHVPRQTDSILICVYSVPPVLHLLTPPLRYVI